MAVLKIHPSIHTWPHKESDFKGDPKEADKIKAYFPIKDSLEFPKFCKDRFDLEVVDYEKVILKANLPASNWVSFTYVIFPVCKDLNDPSKPPAVDERYCAVLCPDGRDTNKFVVWEDPQDHKKFVSDGELVQQILSGLKASEVSFRIEAINSDQLLRFLGIPETTNPLNQIITRADFFDFIEESQGVKLTHDEIDHIFNNAR